MSQNKSPELERDILMKALDNETNSTVINLTTRKIKTIKNNILQKLQITGKKLKALHKTLKNYRYCSDLSDINYGNYIRWIPLKNPDNIKLTVGAYVCDIKIIHSQLYILCKTNMDRFIQFKFDEAIIFQKLTVQELLLLKIMDYMEK